MNALVNALKKSSLEEAAALIRQGEKIPRDLPGYETRQIFDSLLRGKAYGLIMELVNNNSIETDIYEYEKLDGTIFETIFRGLTAAEEHQQFLRDFVAKLDNISDAVQIKPCWSLPF